MVVGPVVRPVAIGGGHIALEALDDRILDVLALVCKSVLYEYQYEYSHALIPRYSGAWKHINAYVCKSLARIYQHVHFSPGLPR